MKSVLIVTLSLILLNSCKKDETYKPFSETELGFVNYSVGQNLKFIDTNNVTQTFVQDTLGREFDEFFSLYGRTSDYHEMFYTLFYVPTTQNMGFTVRVSGGFLPYTPGELSINFSEYLIHYNIDNLPPTTPSMNINGVDYSKVYPLKAYKGGWYPNNPDSATLYYNRQFGPIQLALPNGKSFTRTN